MNEIDNCNKSWNYNANFCIIVPLIMSSKILERLNKIIFENIPANKNLSKVHDKKHISLVCDGVSFY